MKDNIKQLISAFITTPLCKEVFNQTFEVFEAQYSDHNYFVIQTLVKRISDFIQNYDKLLKEEYIKSLLSYLLELDTYLINNKPAIYYSRSPFEGYKYLFRVKTLLIDETIITFDIYTNEEEFVAASEFLGEIINTDKVSTYNIINWKSKEEVDRINDLINMYV